MNLPYIIKVAISEQRIVDAIGKRVDRIAALPADQQGDLALKTKYQLSSDWPISPHLHKNTREMIYERVSKNKFDRIYPKRRILGYNTVPEFIRKSSDVEEDKRWMEIARYHISGKHQEANNKSKELKKIQYRTSNYNNENKFESNKHIDDWKKQLRAIARDQHTYGNVEISPETAKEYKKFIGTTDSKITDAAEDAAPQAMKFMKRYRVPLAIGAGLGLAGLGAGIYAHNKNKEQ